MAIKVGYAPPSNYNTMTELDKMLDYWAEYDGVVKYWDDAILFREWFVHKSTAPELIRRARQWLSEHNYIILKADVSERAYEAGSKFSKAISH